MENAKMYRHGMIRGAIWLTISGLIVKFLGLIYKVPLSYILSDEGMGYFNSAYTVYTFFYLICSAGIPKAISILSAEAQSEGSEEKINEIYKTALLIFSCLGVTATIALVFLASPISRIIGNSESYFTMITIAPSLLFTCISGVLRGYFNGTFNFIPIAISEACSGIGRLVFGLIFGWLGYELDCSLPIISALTILGTTLGAFLGFLCLFVCKKKGKVVTKRINGKSLNVGSPKIVKKLFKFSIPITLTAAVGSLSSIIDLTVIMKRLQSMGFSEFQTGIIYGNYTTLAIPMLNLVGTLVVPLTTVLLPSVSKRTAIMQPSLISERISFIIEILFFFVLPTTVIFSFRSKEILKILFEDTSAEMAYSLLIMLVPAMLFMSLTSVLNTALEGMGETRIPLISLVIAAIFKTILSIVLIGNESFEILGAPLSTSISYMISFLISLYYIKYVKKLEVKLISNAFAALVSSILSITVCSVIRNIFLKETVLHYVLELALFALLYILSILIIKYNYFKERFFGKTNKTTGIHLYK